MKPLGKNATPPHRAAPDGGEKRESGTAAIIHPSKKQPILQRFMTDSTRAGIEITGDMLTLVIAAYALARILGVQP